MIIWILIAVFMANGAPQVGVEAFPTEKECQAEASIIQDGLVSNHINTGSVQCVRTVQGSFS